MSVLKNIKLSWKIAESAKVNFAAAMSIETHMYTGDE